LIPSSRCVTQKMNKSHTDKKLFSRVKKKDKDAFIEAYDLYIDDIYRFVYFKVSSSQEAEDLTSTVFLKTWNYIQHQNIDKAKSLRALIYKIARNLIIDHYRSTKKIDASIDDENAGISIVDEKQNIARQAETSSDFKIVEENLLKLKDEYREIIVMRFIDELSFTEIAQILGKSKDNVRVLVHRALGALRDLLKEK